MTFYFLQTYAEGIYVDRSLSKCCVVTPDMTIMHNDVGILFEYMKAKMACRVFMPFLMWDKGWCVPGLSGVPVHFSSFGEDCPFQLKS